MRRILAAALALSAATVAGCASTTKGLPETLTGPDRVLDAPPGQIVFQIESDGGYAPEGYSLGNRPWLTIYANGDAYLIYARRVSKPGAPVQFSRGSVSGDTRAELVRDADRGIAEADGNLTDAQRSARTALVQLNARLRDSVALLDGPMSWDSDRRRSVRRRPV